jgi:hypothetical protein
LPAFDCHKSRFGHDQFVQFYKQGGFGLIGIFRSSDRQFQVTLAGIAQASQYRYKVVVIIAGRLLSTSI